MNALSSPAPALPARPLPRAALWAFPLALSALVLLGWWGPRLWYSHRATDRPVVWFVESTNLPGWKFTPQSVDKSAEALLAADALFYGQFENQEGRPVRLFTARRFVENPYEVGLFVHTPDRCWTEAGWRIEPVEPSFVELRLGDVPIGAERRLFLHPSGARELVYFFGLVAGQDLPYRLDHNLGVGLRYRRAELADKTGGTLRAVDDLLWVRVWESFKSRRQLFGPKEFVRISTPVISGDLGRADELLRSALPQVLHSVPADSAPGPRPSSAPSPSPSPASRG